jgi:hypothetical protein
MDILTVLGVGYLTTGIMMFVRTYFICVRMINNKRPDSIINKYRILHCIVYILGIAVLIIPAAKVAFSDKARKSWCIGYVNAVLEKK